MLLLTCGVMAQHAPLSGVFVLHLQLHNISEASKAVISYYTVGKQTIDSVAVTDGQATFGGQLLQPVFAQVFLRSASPDRKARQAFENRNWMGVYLTPGATVIVADDSLSNAHYEGESPYIEDFRTYSSATQQFYEKYLRPLYEEISRTKGDSTRRHGLESRIDSLDKELKERVCKTFMTSHPASPVSLLAFRRYAGYVISPESEPLFDSLSPAIRALPEGELIASSLANMRHTRPGCPAPDFALPDTAGRTVSLSSFRSRYVLLDFWASWCGPCRKENPGLVRIFRKYKDRNFTILSVSLDRPDGRDAWLKAIGKDSLTWTNVSDLHYFETQPARLYAIQAIPQNFLIGPDGVIIGTNLFDDELDRSLDSLMTNKDSGRPLSMLEPRAVGSIFLTLAMFEKEICSWLTKQLRLYIPLTDQEGVNIATMFKIRKLNKGDYLLKEGHYGDWWGFVYEGLFRSYSSDTEGNEYTNGFFREGSFTCELVSFNGAAVSPTNVEALEDSLILCVDKQALNILFRDFPHFERFGRLLYEKAFVDYKQHNLFRVRLNASDRYLHFLKNEPELVKRVPLKYIASYLSVTDTSLSRIRRNVRQLDI